MSTRNPLEYALEQLGKQEISVADFIAIWCKTDIAESYRNNFLNYETVSFARTIRLKQNNSPSYFADATFYTDLSGSKANAQIKDFFLALAGAYRFLREGWDFVPSYIKGQTWTHRVVWAWTAYVMHKNLDKEAQRALLHDLGLDLHATSPRRLCALTGALIPVEYTTMSYIEGKEALSMIEYPSGGFRQIHPMQSKWHYYTSPNESLILGYFPKGLATFSVRFDQRNTYSFPDVPFLRALFSMQCPECHYYVKQDLWHDTCCAYCVESKYPNSVIRGYSENALRHVSVQVSIKKPFTMPTKPIHWLTPILLGCELEYNCSSEKSLVSRLSLLKYLEKFVIFKHDGTLNSGGFEVVTAPADLPMHKEKFKPVFDNFPPALAVTTGTGMHIHLDRNALSPLMLGRMVDFMHNSDNKEFIELVGERPCNTYTNQHGLSYQHVLEARSISRYSTLNIAPKNTVEFRIFKTPSTYANFVKNLEFVIALVQYFRTGANDIAPKQGRLFSFFLDYLKKENRSKLEARNTSHYLVTYLKEKRVL